MQAKIQMVKEAEILELILSISDTSPSQREAEYFHDLNLFYLKMTNLRHTAKIYSMDFVNTTKFDCSRDVRAYCVMTLADPW